MNKWKNIVFRISPYSFQMRKNTDQRNSEHIHFLCNEHLKAKSLNFIFLSLNNLEYLTRSDMHPQYPYDFLYLCLILYLY